MEKTKEIEEVRIKYEEKMEEVRARYQENLETIEKRYFVRSNFIVRDCLYGKEWLSNFPNPYIVRIREALDTEERSIEKLHRLGEEVADVVGNSKNEKEVPDLERGRLAEIIIAQDNESSGEISWFSNPVLGIVYYHTGNPCPWIIMGHYGGDEIDRMMAAWILAPPRKSHIFEGYPPSKAKN